MTKYFKSFTQWSSFLSSSTPLFLDFLMNKGLNKNNIEIEILPSVEETGYAKAKRFQASGHYFHGLPVAHGIGPHRG
jgi:hypothetical protein